MGATPSAKQAIEKGEWVDCWICDEVFRRRRQTARYCYTCNRGFCEGEHGNFSHGVGKCIACGLRKADRPGK
jgi:hypothetical protein